MSIPTDILSRLDAKLPFGMKRYLAYNGGWTLTTLNIWQRLVRTLFGAYRNTHLNAVAKAMAYENGVPEEIKARVRKLWYATYPDKKCPVPPYCDPALAARVIEIPSPTTQRRGFDFINRKRPLAFLRKQFEQLDHPVRLGIEKLSKAYDYYPIADDRHCLFRAIVAGLLLQLQEQVDLKNKVMERLDDLLDSIDIEDTLRQDAQWFKDIIRQLKRDSREKSFFKCIDDKEFSDRLVSFFRNLAVTYGKSDPHMAAAIPMEQWQRLQNFEQGDVGGQEVLQALAKSLQIAFHVVHLQAVGEGDDLKAPRHFFASQNPIVTIELLLSENHYDLAVLKPR